MTQENMLARYKILHEVGRGALGAVYAALDRATGARVALKRVDPALLNQSEANFAERILKHARSARNLKHRNIVELHEAGQTAGTVFVAMELLEGESLRKILDEGPLPIARAIRIAHGIASGLAYAHLEGMVHGGIKPSNIIVLRSGEVKITDFGTGRTDLSYLSAEQMRGDPVDYRSDIFSLGALLYEMLAHQPPVGGDSPPPSELNPHVPRALDAIVLGMLAEHPAVRMPGIPILLRDLQRLEEGLGLGSGANASTDEPTASVPPGAPEPVPSPAEEVQHPGPTTDREVFDYQKAIAIMERESRLERPSRSRTAIFAALAVVLAVLGIGFSGFTGLDGFTGLTGFIDDWSDRIERWVAASSVREAPTPASADSRPTAPPAAAEVTKEPVTAAAAPAASSAVASAPNPSPSEPLVAEPSPSAQTERLLARASGPQRTANISAPNPSPPEPLVPQPSPPAQTQSLLAREPEPPTIRQSQSGGRATLILAVSPRGEIYINGERAGMTPPITKFDLEPGMHRIEVRSGKRKPYLTYMTVQAGDVRRIRHDFNAKPGRPPR